MPERATLKLSQARAQTPPQALGDWTLSLREAAYNAVTEEDITAIMRRQVEKAKTGDPVAAKFVLEYFTKLPTTTISMGIRGAVADRDKTPRIVVPGKPVGESDDELDRRIEKEREAHPLWKPSPYALDDPRHNAIVKERTDAGLPARHPGDAQPNLE